jgi:hypothetical protein
VSKRLNIDVIQNELSGGSAFFPNYANKQAPDAPTEEKPARTIVAEKTIMTPVPPVRPVLPVQGKNPKPSLKRVMKSRHPFDIYEDQYHSLRELAMKERTQGGIGSMSAVMREAIDVFIEKRRRSQ